MAENDARYQITPESLATLEAELARLEGEGRREIAARIKTAREWGDLKENGEYHAAKEAQAHLETQILRLRDRILNAVVVESAAGGEEVALGSTVTVLDQGTQRTATYTFVSAAEADPTLGRLSLDSPVGRALLGAREGDVRTLETPRGERCLEVKVLA